jgi:MHS family proline/betaine transporter-like MFS transporter
MAIPGHLLKRRILASSIIGNTLEFYDFTLCGVFVATLGSVFFPLHSEQWTYMFGFSAFAAAFLTRPLGAFVFGYIGDRYGRKVALTWSVTLMGIPTFIISILPSYEMIGWFAPVVLIICRLLQGLCTGGEYNGAAIFALEHLKAKPGMVSGMIAGSCAVGALVATLVGYITLGFDAPWAWRVPFAFGALVSFIGFLIRRRTTETDDFLKSSIGGIKVSPIKKVWKEDRKSLLLSTAYGFINGVLSYTLLGFLAVYIKQYVGYTASQGIFYSLFGLLSFMSLCPVFGGYADQISPVTSLKLAGRLGIVLPFICFWLLQTQNGLTIVIGQLLLGTLVASYVGPSHYFMQTLFPISNRYTGAALGFTLGIAMSGSSTPLILTYMLDVTHNLYIPAIYIVMHSVIWLSILEYLAPKIKIHYKNIPSEAA